jgi:hypothetical protein
VLKLVKIEETTVNRKLGWAAHLFEDFDWDAWDALDIEVAAMWNQDNETK